MTLAFEEDEKQSWWRCRSRRRGWHCSSLTPLYRTVAALLYLPSSHLGGLACFVTCHIELQCDEQRNKSRFVPELQPKVLERSGVPQEL